MFYLAKVLPGVQGFLDLASSGHELGDALVEVIPNCLLQVLAP